MNIHLNTLKTKNKKINNYKTDKFRFTKSSEIIDSLQQERYYEALLNKFKESDEQYQKIIDCMTSVNPMDSIYYSLMTSHNYEQSIVDELVYIELKGMPFDIINFFENSLSEIEEIYHIENIFNTNVYNFPNKKKHFKCLNNYNESNRQFKLNNINELFKKEKSELNNISNKDNKNLCLVDSEEISIALTSLESASSISKQPISFGFFALIKKIKDTNDFFIFQSIIDSNICLENMGNFNLTYKTSRPFNNLKASRNNFIIETNLEKNEVIITFNSSLSLIEENIQLCPTMTMNYQDFNERMSTIEKNIYKTSLYLLRYENKIATHKSLPWTFKPNNIPKQLFSIIEDYFPRDLLQEYLEQFFLKFNDDWKILKEEYELNCLIPIKGKIDNIKSLKF